MSVSWTQEMTQALQTEPSRMKTESGEFVLVRAGDYAHLRQKHPELPDAETVADPVSGHWYALVLLDIHTRFQLATEAHPDTGLAPPPFAHGLRRAIYLALGLFFVGLAIFGVITPILPTTPFLLLSAFFFARSSSRLHHWLLRSRLFGGLIRDWQRHRGVRPRVKVVALTLMPAVVFSSAYFGRLPWLLVLMLIGLALVGAVVVLRLKTIRDQPGDLTHVTTSTDATTTDTAIPPAHTISTSRTPHTSAQ